jgi:hypothetical protein
MIAPMIPLFVSPGTLVAQTSVCVPWFSPLQHAAQTKVCATPQEESLFVHNAGKGRFLCVQRPSE